MTPSQCNSNYGSTIELHVCASTFVSRVLIHVPILTRVSTSVPLPPSQCNSNYGSGIKCAGGGDQCSAVSSSST